MKDSDRRAIVLQAFYDRRHTHAWTELPVDVSAPAAEKITVSNICAQLAEHGLVEWKSPGGHRQC
jgi:hypothetical protein